MHDGSPKHFDLLVHIGAGACREIDQHLASAHRVVLVEPNFDVVIELQERLADRDQIEIFEAAVGNGEATRQFEIRNWCDFSGFYKPTLIKRLYCGLSDTKCVEVRTQDAASFLESVAKDTDNSVAIIVDVNGAELEVLQSLERANWLPELSSVTVYCGVEPLFEGALCVEDVVEILKPHGSVTTNGVGHMRRVQLQKAESRRNADGVLAELTANRKLQLSIEELETVRSAEQEAQKVNRTLRAHLMEVQSQYDALLAELADERLEHEAENDHRAMLSRQNERMKGELDQARINLDEKKAKLAETSSKLDAAVVDQDRLKQEIQVLRAETLQLKQELDTVEKEFDSFRSEYSHYKLTTVEAERRLRDEVETVRNQLSVKEHSMIELQSSNVDLTRRCEDLEKVNLVLKEDEIPQLRTDLAVALRSRAMADADLRALRVKHAEVVDAKRDREQLLSLLSDRLSQASAYLELASEDGVDAFVLTGGIDELADGPEPPPQSSASRSNKKR